MRLSSVLKGAAALGVVLIIALIAAVKAIDLNKYKDFLTGQVKAATGRELVIAGQLELKPGLVPLFVANGVSLANAPGGSRAEMIKVERIEAEIALLPLLKREVRIQRLVMSVPDILLEAGNWRLAGQTTDVPVPTKGVPLTRFSLRELKIKNGRLTWRDPAGHADSMNLHKLTIQPDQGAAGLLVVQVLGDYQARNFEIAGKVGGIAALGGGKPWPVQVTGSFHGMTLAVDGTVAHPLALDGIDLKLAAHGDEAAEIARFAGYPLPAIGPFKLVARLNEGGGKLGLSEIDAAFGRRDIALVSAKGAIRDARAASGLELVIQAESENLAGLSRLTGRDIPSMGPLRLFGALRGGGETFHLVDLRAALAGSDLAGEAALALAPGKRPHLFAKVHSNTLILADFTTPAAKPGERLEPRAIARPSGDGRLFSADPLPVDTLRALDADVTLHVGRLLAGPSALTDASLGAELHNGRLHIGPVRALLAGGALDGDAVLNASGPRPSLSLRLVANHVELARIAKDSGSGVLGGGKADLRLNFSGAGLSARELMASASGEAMINVGEGRIHNRAVDWAGGDLVFQLLGSINPMARTDETTAMSCAVARFEVKNGVASADRGIAVETAKVNVIGGGIVDLRSEQLDLGIASRARDGLGLSLGGQLAGITRLRGTLAQPAITIDEIGTAKAAASVGAAVATGGLSLLGELLFDKVTADANPCRTALGGRSPAKAKPAGRGG